MILDRTWNKREQKLVISYVNKSGDRQFYTKYLHHIKSYEYDESGEFETWNGKRCSRVFKDTSTYVPNEFDILEFMYEMEPEINKQLHAQWFSKLYAFDIETKFIPGQKPDPENAPFEVTSISLVGPDMSCIVYGLKPMNAAQIALAKKRYLDWIENNEFAKKIKNSKFNGKEPKFLYQYFQSEKDMLIHWFTIIVPKISCLAGWNSYNFDWTYLVNRAKRLFGSSEAMNMLRKSSPTGEITNHRYEVNAGTHAHVTIPRHTIVLDYMLLVKKYDRVIAPVAESFGLDWIASNTPDIKAHKIPYDGTLEDLYAKDPEWYYFYNAIDSLLVVLIHYRLKSLESPCAVDSVTLVPVFDAMGQVALTTANVFEEFYNDGKKVVYDYDAIERTKIEFEGAYCNCVPGRYEWNVCDDFASLYPSQVQTCNFSFENFYVNRVGPDSLGRYTTIPWTESQLQEFREDPNYFVSIMGNVYKNDKDYAFKKMQRRIKKNRDKYKYTGQEIDSILLVQIDKLIAEKEGKNHLL